MSRIFRIHHLVHREYPCSLNFNYATPTRLAEGFEHHRFGWHAAGVRVAASTEAVVVEGARFRIDVQPVNPNGRAAKITMPHRLFFDGNILNTNG